MRFVSNPQVLAAITPTVLHTVCVIAAYADENGFSIVTESQLAPELGITRARAYDRVRRTLAYRYRNQPLLERVVCRRQLQPDGSTKLVAGNVLKVDKNGKHKRPIGPDGSRVALGFVIRRIDF